MRKLVPQIGDTRTVVGFLYLPMTLPRADDRKEERWLEFAGVKYQWRTTKGGEGWCPIAWADSP